MSFYTNVVSLGNNILFRGISSDGKRFKERIEYHPTLFVPTKEKTSWNYPARNYERESRLYS